MEDRIQKATKTAKEAKKAATKPKKSREVTEEDIEAMAREQVEDLAYDEGY